jgi:hypothetical protein
VRCPGRAIANWHPSLGAHALELLLLVQSLGLDCSHLILEFRSGAHLVEGRVYINK